MIALIITIIVLLILAGVSIATLTGDNGLLTKANSVKTRTEEAQIEEEIILAYNFMQMKDGTTEEKLAIMREELKRQDSGATAQTIDESLTGNYKGYSFTINGGKVTLASNEESGEVVGTREDWGISDDGTLGLYKGPIPSNKTIVTPTIVDGIKVNAISTFKVDGLPLSFIWREDESPEWRYL